MGLRAVASLVLLGLLVGCGAEVQTAAPAQPAVATPPAVAIVPKPRSLQVNAGEFRLTARTQLVADGAALPVAQYLQKQFGRATGYQLPLVQASDQPAIRFILDPSVVGQEAYALQVSEQGIAVRAATATGLFWGVQSLRQLLPVEIEAEGPVHRDFWSVPAVSIADEPAFPYRGMHLDVSRSFMPVEFIQQYIDLLALHKLNRFHWHLTDDQGWRIEIKKYPRLTQQGAWRDTTIVGHTYDKDGLYDGKLVGGYYTQEQIRFLVAYAAERQVTIIPEVDIPGHASAILAAYPEYGCTGKATQVQSHFGVFPAVLCPTEQTFAFLEDVFTEVTQLFPSDYIHIGGDEVKTVEWADCQACSELMARENIADYFALQGYMVRRVEAVLNKLGRQIIGWDEILEGGVAPSATITSWRGIEGAIHAAREGHDAIMAPGSHLYFDHYQSRSIDEPLAIHGLTPVRETYEFEVIPAELRNDPAAARILGAQGHLWTEYVRTPAKALYMVLPRMSALAEVVWTEDAQKTWPDFAQRLPALFRRFDAMGLNYARSVYAVNTQVERAGQGFAVSLSSDMPGVAIRYTLDGSEPHALSPVYQQPLPLTGGLLRARAQDPRTGRLYGERRLTLNNHKALGASVKLLTEADRAWNKMPELSLVDGVLARDQIFQLDDWATFNGVNFEAELDFGKVIEFSSVGLGINPGKYRHFYGPTGLQLLVSDDGASWREVARADPQTLAQATLSVRLEFAAVQSRYLKVVAENNGTRYSTEDEKDLPVTLYIDELIVQ